MSAYREYSIRRIPHWAIKNCGENSKDALLWRIEEGRKVLFYSIDKKTEEIFHINERGEKSPGKLRIRRGKDSSGKNDFIMGDDKCMYPYIDFLRSQIKNSIQRDGEGYVSYPNARNFLTFQEFKLRV